jgi:4-hydroxy-tetrahydrodipicolinate synthase
MFKGIFTALITPFKSGKVDYKSFQNLIEWQIESGVHGLVVAGTTGEGPALSDEEFEELLGLAVKTSKKRVPVVANTGLNNTAASINLTKKAEKLQADAIMAISPYYVKPTQEGLYQHFKAIHDASNLPILLYNNPPRTSVDISNEVLERLSKLPRIKGIKECSGNPVKCAKLKLIVKDDFDIVTGDDILALPYYSQGAVGMVSAVANIIPSLTVKLFNLWNSGRINEAMELQSILLPIHEVLFCESNPIAVKYAASLFGICSSELRLPLVGPSDANKKLVENTLEELKVKLNEYAN